MPTLWKFTSANKAVFPEGKRHELGKRIQFAKLWFETPHIDRGKLVREWSAGNYISSVQKTGTGTNAGGSNKTDRNPDYTHTLDTLDVEIALATMPMDFDIYNFPASIHRRAKEIVQKKKARSKNGLLRCVKPQASWIIHALPFLPSFVAPPAIFIISR